MKHTDILARRRIIGAACSVAMLFDTVVGAIRLWLWALTPLTMIVLVILIAEQSPLEIRPTPEAQRKFEDRIDMLVRWICYGALLLSDVVIWRLIRS